MIEDNEQFFRRHPDSETKTRGLFIVACLAQLREVFVETSIEVKTMEGARASVIRAALVFHKGNVLAAARQLRIGRQSLYRHIAENQLSKWINSLRETNQKHEIPPLSPSAIGRVHRSNDLPTSKIA